MKKIILASKSPYRKELLSKLHIPFECLSSSVDEDKFKNEITDPFKLATTLAYEKAQDVFKKNQDAIIIGSDQLGSIENKILSKPHTQENALKELMHLQGKEHKLITSVCILSKDSKIEFQNVTTLKMKSLTEKQIQQYISIDKPFDCAGSYKLECSGIALFEKIVTDDQSAIIGLPLLELSIHLQDLGFSVFSKEV